MGDAVVAEELADLDKGYEDFSGEGYTQVRVDPASANGDSHVPRARRCVCA